MPWKGGQTFKAHGMVDLVAKAVERHASTHLEYMSRIPQAERSLLPGLAQVEPRQDDLRYDGRLLGVTRQARQAHLGCIQRDSRLDQALPR